MEKYKPTCVVVDSPPDGNIPHSVRIERVRRYLHSHPSFKNVGVGQAMAIVRNEGGFIISALGVEKELLEAEGKGGADRRMARLDVCDMLKITQDIIDN